MEFNTRLVAIKNYREAKEVMVRVGTDEGGQKYMQSKALFYTILVDNLSLPAATILKQDMLSRGGEAAVHKEAILCNRIDRTSVLLMGTVNQYRKLILKLKSQPFRLKQLADELDEVIRRVTKEEIREIACVNGPLVLGERTLIMGILNVTPDSFSDGGHFYQTEQAIAHARSMIEAGADIIDVGGESTRPGAQPVGAEEELNRVLPVIRALAQAVKVPISVDTYKAEVARKALDAGAAIINDVWGFQRDPDIATVAAEYNCPVVLMHNRDNTDYKDLMGEIIAFLRRSIKIAEDAGVNPDKIFIDPGIGFGKNLEQNLGVMHRMEELKTLGKPILLGTSRKSMIGKVLDLPVEERREGTAATITLGIAKGVDIVRVHDITEMARVVKMTDAMVRG